MKNIVSLGFAIVICCQLQAQQYSAGFRTGASYWMDKQEGKCITNSLDGQNTTWDKEIFVRYKTKGKLVFEASMGHYAFNNTMDGSNYYCVFGKDEATILSEKINERSQNIEWNISAQYDVSCPALQQKCPVMKNLKSYIGVLATPTLSRNTTTVYYGEGDFSSESSRDEWTVWTGLTHTLVYTLCDHMYLTSAVRMQIDPNNFFDNSGILKNRDSRIGFQVGVGYNFQ